MSYMRPKFSIVIPTYNRAERLRVALQKLQEQHEPDFEVVIVDDGSSDATKEVVEAFDERRFKYIFQTNSERAVARNRGVEASSGEYITFLDSDDVVYAHHLATAKTMVESHSSPPWFHLNYEIRTDHGELVSKARTRRGDLGKQLLTGNHLSCIGVFVRRDVLSEHKFDEDQRLIGSEDYDLWLRLSLEHELIYSNEVTSCMIQHPVRSVMGFSEERLKARIDYHIEKVSRLKIDGFKTFVAHRLLYLALHMAMMGQVKSVLNYLFRSVKLQTKVLFSRKVGGIVKVSLKLLKG